MNSNSDTFIKQEILTGEEELISSIPDIGPNVLVKNEPIEPDETFSAITIKNEPPVDASCLIETVSIKTEQNLETILESRNSFAIYEVETQMQNGDKEVSGELFCSTSPVPIKNTIQATKTALRKTESSLNLNLYQTNLINHEPVDGIATKVAATTPILLNDKLRKRHKIIISAKPADKRKRYNIEKRGKSNNTSLTVSTTENSKICRLLNSGNKKIINHLVKNKPKQKQKVSAKNYDLSRSPTKNRDNKSQNMELNFADNYREQIEQQTATATQTQPNTLATISSTILPTPVNIDNFNTPKQLIDSSSIPELRVKCLCSLTDDAPNNNDELREFFDEMFMETRCLNRSQQRLVKMSLLNAICKAEDAVEEGKCCNF